MTVVSADLQTTFADTITYSGFGGASRTITVNYALLGSVLISGSPQTYGALFPELLNNSTSTTYNPYVVSSVVLPNNQSYQFKYNVYGELARVTLLTGGAIEYDFAAGVSTNNADGVFVESYPEIYRRVVQRRVFTNGSAMEGLTNYSRPEGLGTYGTTLGYVDVDHFKPDGTTLLAKERHYFYGDGAANSLSSEDPFAYTQWTFGKEYRTQLFDTDGATLLRQTDNTWQQPVAGTRWPLGSAETQPGVKSNDPHITATQFTLADTNQVSKQTFAYDQYNNRTDVYEYDYGSGAAGALLRQTHTDYKADYSYVDAQYGAHIRNLPSSSVVKNGGGTTLAQTDIFYDEYGLSTYGAASTWNDPGTSARGNATTVRKYYKFNPDGYFDSHANYDQLGNPVSTTDIRGKVTTISYADNFSDNTNRNTYALPTQVTSPVPDTSGTYGSNTAFVTSTKYDYSTGHATSTTDANNQTTTADYTDSLDRLKQVNAPDGGITQYIYTDTPGNLSLQVLTRLNSSSSTNLQSYKFFDGLGRSVRTQVYAYSGSSSTNDTCDSNNPYSTIDTQYDAMGRAYKVSNPYCMLLNGSVNPSGNWTTTAYDALSRVSSVTTPDSAQVSSAYSGNTVTVTDQASNKRKSVSDALGRLTDVYEDPTGANYQTHYDYNTIDALTQVTQGSQTRTFQYDSLKRLTSATNPENSTVSYYYDENSYTGLLTHRVDARGVRVDFDYDNINRQTKATYTLTTGSYLDATPNITRKYDFATNGKGRLYQTQTADVSIGTSPTVLHTKSDHRRLAQMTTL